MQKVIIMDLQTERKSLYDSYDIIQKRNKIQSEINSDILTNLSHEKYVKTKQEKAEAIIAKLTWRAQMRLKYPDFTNKSDFYTQKVKL